mgnify:CR=1 FL=1|tara:strand:+ start:6025 stop:8814 length:2790 start_codon:yes stop_codon:yes gene_type:complete
MAMDLIITKLFPPVSKPSRVVRPHLEKLLNKNALRRVTLISAGAGFGKSTLMTEWYRTLQGQGVAVAWISLDVRDQDQGQLLSYLIEALRMAGAVEGKTAENLLQNKRENRFFSVLGALINEMAALQGTVVLFLDDYHFADCAETSRIMENFISLAPPNVHFVIASRSRPQLPLATLKVHEDLMVLSEKELRFSDREAAEFMQDRRGLNISEHSLRRLIQSTEGWVAGLQLISLAVRDKRMDEHLLRQFSGSSRDVVDFLAHNVFSHQPEHIRTFMMRTAVPERFNAELCECLTGETDAQDALEYLEDNNLFIIPLDEGRGWYRYHHLYREFLLTQLKRYHKEELASLQRTASQWFADAGLIVEAVSLADESGDYDYLATLVGQHAENILIRGHMPLLLDWVRKIPENIARTKPLISVYEGYALFHMRRPVEAASAGYRAEEIIREAEKAGSIPVEELVRLKQEVKVIKAGVAIASDDVEQAKKYASVPLQTTVEKSGFMVGAMKNMLGYACASLNKFDAAREALLEARKAHEQVNSVYGVVYADCFLGMAEMAMGHLQDAYELFLHAEKISRGDRLPNSPAIAVSRLYQGLVCYEWGDLGKTLNLITENIELVDECGQAEAPITGYIVLARLYRALGQPEKVYEPLEAASRICREDELHRLHVLTEYEYIRQLLVDGFLPEAQDRARLAGVMPDDIDADLKTAEWDRVKCVRFLIKSRLLLALGREDQAISLLQHLKTLALAVRRRRRALEIMALLARAYLQKGERAEALNMLDHALRLARPEKYIRLFADEGQEIGRLLAMWLAAPTLREPELHATGAQILAAFEGEHPRGQGTVISPPQPIKTLPIKTLPGKILPGETGHVLLEPLSEREVQVLTLLSKGYSNQKIGQSLSIAENTVKWHIRNLFEKLGVKNRTSAVLAAQNLNLI